MILREWELAFLDFIQTHLRSAFTDTLVPMITALGDSGFIWIVLAAVLLFRKSWRRTGVIVAVALIIEALLCNVLLKNLFAVPRPFEWTTAVELLIPQPDDYSFPSGHTGASFAAVTALYYGGAKYWYLVLLPAVLIAFSRLYLYVHFPSDVIGGIVLGIFSGWLAARLLTVVEQRKG